jgi:hypothetical protein
VLTLHWKPAATITEGFLVIYLSVIYCCCLRYTYYSSQITVAQTSFSLQRLTPYDLPFQFDSETLQLLLKAGQKNRHLLLWFAVGVVATWNWLFVSAAIAGASVSVMSYQLQQGQWTTVRLLWQRLWKPTNRSLTVAVGAGTLAMLTTYLALNAWLVADSPQQAIASVLQGGGTMAIALLLLAWRIRPATRDADTQPWDALSDQLSDANPLKRLTAIRRATDHALRSSVTTQRRYLLDSFRLMLKYETDDILQMALVESIQALQQQHCLGTGAPALSMPMETRHGNTEPTAIATETVMPEMTQSVRSPYLEASEGLD